VGVPEELRIWQLYNSMPMEMLMSTIRRSVKKQLICYGMELILPIMISGLSLNFVVVQ